MADISAQIIWSLRVVAAVLQGLAILLTVIRLSYRIRIQRFWWEDTWAAIALALGISFFVSEWVYLNTTGQMSTSAYWVYTFSFTCVVWATRMSVVFSVVRLTYPLQLRRYIAIGIIALFVVMWASMVVQKAYLCGRFWRWQIGCRLLKSMIISEVSADCISDSILVALPVRLLWNVRLPRRERRVILCIFSTSVVMSLVSLFHAFCQFADILPLVYLAVNFEVALSLIVCNLLVLVTLLYRILRKDGNLQTQDDSNNYTSAITQPTGPVSFTTVDLSELTGDMRATRAPDQSGVSSEVTTTSLAKSEARAAI